ncbi:helix-turn-helix transcriptional regulator [Brachybacterium sp. Z12]|uniref:helix-turn-helix transcriptional regulator n=1 Tax=Brachybacterium sp. Z12 TaxID=2759167 RepID=UPI00223B5A8F|nr:helix-turn-helix transcriptional regulator [Brachybacterium sp. Z12]
MPVARRDPSGASGRDRTLWDVITLTPPRAEDRFSSVLHFAHENAATLDVADLAAQAGYSPFHFTRIFSARMGIGPGQYLTALRIDAAKRMLLAGDDAVIDVASAVGFDSLSSFSRRFRSTVGVAPGQLRRLADRISDRRGGSRARREWSSGTTAAALGPAEPLPPLTAQDRTHLRAPPALGLEHQGPMDPPHPRRNDDSQHRHQHLARSQHHRHRRGEGLLRRLVRLGVRGPRRELQSLSPDPQRRRPGGRADERLGHDLPGRRSAAARMGRLPRRRRRRCPHREGRGGRRHGHRPSRCDQRLGADVGDPRRHRRIHRSVAGRGPRGLRVHGHARLAGVVRADDAQV